MHLPPTPKKEAAAHRAMRGSGGTFLSCPRWRLACGMLIYVYIYDDGSTCVNDRQRDFGDTAMVKPHLAFTHTRELLGKQYTPTLATAYGPQYFPYEIVGTPLSLMLSFSLSRALSTFPMR